MCEERLEVVTPRSRNCITAYFREISQSKATSSLLQNGDRIIRNTRQIGADIVVGDEVLEKARLWGIESWDRL